jgi:hypothetical protein
VPNIYIPTRSPEDWRQFLAEPEKHWRTGYSARATAYAWQEANGFPTEIADLLSSASDDNLREVELLLAIPEHKVYFPPMQGHPSQNDVFALAKAINGDLLSIAVEAKVLEPFDLTVDEWIVDPTRGKTERLEFLKDKLHIVGKPIGNIRYQLLHRLCSALLEAERFSAKYAILVIHSFSQLDEWFDDFVAFLSLYDQEAVVGQLVALDLSIATKVFAGWARGNAKYLDA